MGFSDQQKSWPVPLIMIMIYSLNAKEWKVHSFSVVKNVSLKKSELHSNKSEFHSNKSKISL